MKKFAKERNKRLIIDNDDPEYFSAGISNNGDYCGIGVNPSNALPYEAQFVSGEFPQSEEEEVGTIEEAIEWLENWI